MANGSQAAWAYLFNHSELLKGPFSYEITISLSATLCVRNVNDPTDITMGPSSDSRGANPAEDIQQEINRIRNGPHESMPQGQSIPSALGGQSAITVENGTSCALSVLLSGPRSQRMQLAPGRSQHLEFSPGDYELAANIACPNIIPYYGKETFGANVENHTKFYISAR
jgi:hypothetical protein